MVQDFFFSDIRNFYFCHLVNYCKNLEKVMEQCTRNSITFSPRASRSISLKVVVVVVVLVVVVVVVSVVTFCKNSQITVDKVSTDGAYSTTSTRVSMYL